MPLVIIKSLWYGKDLEVKMQCPHCNSMLFQAQLKEVETDENLQRAIVLVWVCDQCKSHVMDVEDDKQNKTRRK